jgi:exodeoxyribonuclease VII small subunit
MSDDRSTFETTRARLDDIVTQVRRKDVSLEQSLDMLEEAVRLVNQCNDLIDQTSFRATPASPEGSEAVAAVAAAGSTDPDPVVDAGQTIEEIDADRDGLVEVIDVVDLVDTDGDGVVDVRVETVTVLDAGEWGAEDAWSDSDAGGHPDGTSAGSGSPEDDARE